MAKTYHSSNRWALTGLFKRINLGDDPKLLQNEASHLADKINSDDIAAAQQALIDEGLSSQVVQKISSVFVLMGLHKEKTGSKEAKLPDNHILQKILAEHTLARYYLADLAQITEEIDHLDSLTDVSSEFRRLVQAVDHFHRFKRHIEREEDIIFPYLRKHGWKGLCKADEDEHEKIVADIDSFVTLISSLNTIEFDHFKNYLQKFVKHFVPLLQGHLSYEEELLWPIALVVIDNAETWETIKAFCNEFEY